MEPDDNHNGIPNSRECDPSHPTVLDSDGDGYSSLCEMRLGTDPCNAESHPDPTKDTDNDGLTDVVEASMPNGPDWQRFDTDGDGVQDLAEIELGLDPRNPRSDGSTPDAQRSEWLSHDLDGDRLYDEYELRRGWNPANPDMDGDGVLDGIEVANGTDPLTPNWIPSYGPDTDGDGLSDADEETLHTDPYSWDTDGDGISDGAEVQLGLNPVSNDSDLDGVFDGDEDSDYDGLSNSLEMANGTNPGVADSDGDGVPDGVEVAQGSNPLDPNEHDPVPAGQFVDVTVSIGDPSYAALHRWGVHVGQYFVASPPFGHSSTQTLRLRRGKSYDVTVVSLGFRTDCAQVNCPEPGRQIREIEVGSWGHVAGTPYTDVHLTTACGPDGGFQFSGSDVAEGNSETDLSFRTSCRYSLAGSAGPGTGTLTYDYDAISRNPLLPPTHEHSVIDVSAFFNHCTASLGQGWGLGTPQYSWSDSNFRTPSLVTGSARPLPPSSPYSYYRQYHHLLQVSGSASNTDYSYSCDISINDSYSAIDDPQTLLGSHLHDSTWQQKHATMYLPWATFIPDPATQSDPDALHVLPGDIETLTARCESSPAMPLVFSIGNPTTAKFVIGPNTFSDTVAVTGGPQVLRVVGMSAGAAEIQVRRPGTTDDPFQVFTVWVGGNLRIEYDQSPTFIVHPTDAEATAGPPDDFEQDDGDIVIGGNPIYVDAQPPPALHPADPRLPIAADILNTINQASGGVEAECHFRVVVTDGQGNPRRGKKVLIVPQHDYVEIGTNFGPILTTDDSGTAEAVIRSNLHNLPNYTLRRTLGLQMENLAVIVGQDAIDVSEGSTTTELINSLRDGQSIYLNGQHKFTGHSIRFDNAFIWNGTTSTIAMRSINLPIINHAQYTVLANVLGPTIYADPFDQTGQVLLMWDPETEQFVTPWTVPAYAPLISQSREAYLTATVLPSLAVRWQHDFGSVPGLQTAQLSFVIEPVDPENPPPGGWSTAWTVGATVGEFGLGFVPGYDVVDVVKEGFWYPVILGDTSTEHYVVASVALLGLAADAGYLAGPAGLATNAATSALKTLVKRIPPSARRTIFKVGETAVRSARLLEEYAAKIPKPPGMSYYDWARKVITELEQRWQHVLNSPLHLDGEHLNAAIRVINGKSTTRILSRHAHEGIAGYAKFGEGGENTIKAALDHVASRPGLTAEVIEDSTESVSEAFGKTYRNGMGTAQVPHVKEVQRINEAAAAATRNWDPHLRSVVQNSICDICPFKTMEEFEALRFMKAESLTAEQVTVINLVREAITISPAETMCKVISNDYAVGTLIGQNVGTVEGFIAREADLAGAASTSAVIDRLRLDYDGPFSAISAGEPHVLLKTEATPLIAGQARIPRGNGFSNGSAAERAVPGTYPYVGNGFTASRDGHLTPEWHLGSSVQMKPDATIMYFRNADGSPRTLTLGSLSSDRWILRDGGGGTLFWQPLP